MTKTLLNYKQSIHYTDAKIIICLRISQQQTIIGINAPMHVKNAIMGDKNISSEHV